MSRQVLMFYQSDVKFGGWPTDTVHLYFGLQEAGYHPILARVTDRKDVKEKKFGRGINIVEIPLYVGKSWVEKLPSFVVVSAPKQAEYTQELVKSGAGLLVHDPTEWKGGCLASAFEDSRIPILVHRKAVAEKLRELGVESFLALHPYKAIGFGAGKPTQKKRQWKAVSISRVDFDKRTHTIAEANESLDDEHKIHIYGALNRIYEYHQLRKAFPEWKRNYYGKFSSDSVWAAVGICEQSQAMVDMSVIKGDGGGTQMTTLEAIDAGCSIILNKEWLTGDPDIDEVASVATFVTTASELADAVREHKPIDHKAALELMQRHDAKLIAQQLVGWLKQ